MLYDSRACVIRFFTAFRMTETSSFTTVFWGTDPLVSDYLDRLWIWESSIISAMMFSNYKVGIYSSHLISFFKTSMDFPCPLIIQFVSLTLRVMVELADIMLSSAMETPFRIVFLHPIHT